MIFEQHPCPRCDAMNAFVRRRCRECGDDLVQHPDREIDVEVRREYADARRYERSVGIERSWRREQDRP